MKQNLGKLQEQHVFTNQPKNPKDSPFPTPYILSVNMKTITISFIWKSLSPLRNSLSLTLYLY